ncbi:condensation-domain-containing protein, partial [Lindgomyces ingoldianus]
QIEAKVRDRLQTMLPTYMVPSRIVVLDQMPVNSNRKVDRKELAKRAKTATKSRLSKDRVAPRNDIEGALCEEFTKVLGVDVSVMDDFFELGGHSLMATKLAARLGRRLNAKVSVKDVFDHPVLADLASTIQQGSEMHVTISRMRHDGLVEQSFAQGRLWFLDKLNLGTSWYIIPLVTRLHGSLDVVALTAALQALEKRHESLRTTFEERDNVGVQVVQPFRSMKLRITDVSDAEVIEAVKVEQTRTFDLSAEPGWRVRLFRISKEDHVLSVVMHHIVSDGWSTDVLCRELDMFYSAALRGDDPLSHVMPLPIQYRDFTIWQKQAKQVAEQQKQLNYWTKQLANSAPAELLCDRPRPKVLSGEASYIPITINGSLYQDLQAYCRSQQVTPFVVLLAAFRATHYRLTGAEDATVGTPIANRNRPELENLIGFFVNTQCMRITVNDIDDTFESLVQQVRSTATAAFANQDVPFEQLVSALLPGSRDTSCNPLVQLMFAVHSQRDLGKLRLEGLQGELVPLTPTTRLDVEFHLFQEGSSLNGSVLYATDLFEAATINSMIAVFLNTLRRGLEKPQTPVATLTLLAGKLPELRSQGLLDIRRVEYPRESSIVDIFRNQVAVCPKATAVKDSSTELTYDKLDQQSD